MLLLLCIKSLYVSGLVWDLHLNFPPVLSSDVAIRTVVITQPCDGYSLALSCGSENVLILISLLSLMMFLVVLDDFLFFFGCATRLLGSQFPTQKLNSGHGSENPES